MMVRSMFHGCARDARVRWGLPCSPVRPHFSPFLRSCSPRFCWWACATAKRAMPVVYFLQASACMWGDEF